MAGGSVVWLGLAAGCESRSATRPAPARSTASAQSTEAANPPAVRRAELKVGDEVEVCWRRAASAAPFSKNDAPYRCASKVRAAPAPWEPGEGGVHGRMLTKALGPELDGKRAWLRAVELERDPRAPGSGIGLDDSESSYFNEYVGIDSAGRARVYVEIEAR